ncbi:MAG: hypothetical protein WCB68_09645 [Pyrinomonadaceae bacterium]
MREYNLCFLGFGNVGRALARLLQTKSKEMREQFGIKWRITGVAARRMGWIASPDGIDVDEILAGKNVSQDVPAPDNVRDWLRAARADVLFETSSLEPFTGQPAIEHIRAALENGAHAITANKGAVVHGFEELSALAATRGKCFMFESTVADCLPVFSLFRETLPAARLLSFRAVLNSTTNIILEEIERGRTFDEGVARAQALGVTETDPGYDVDGLDSAVKVCALARVLMNAPLMLEEIQREGIRHLSAESIREARAAGTPFKLISQAQRTDDGRILASVRPEQLASDDPLASTSGTTLTINFELDVLHGMTLTAHNPNLKSTAYGLLADFINAVTRS